MPNNSIKFLILLFKENLFYTSNILGFCQKSCNSIDWYLLVLTREVFKIQICTLLCKSLPYIKTRLINETHLNVSGDMIKYCE